MTIDEPRVARWIERAVPGVVPPVRFDLVTAGRSNLTYRVTDASGSRWAMRRPPFGPLLPTAHDVAREHRILAALATADVPVPAVVALCDDETVSDVPLLVMSYVDGIVLRDEEAARSLTVEQRRTVAASLVDTLAALHAVDPDAIGLGDLSRRDAYVERQLRRWRRQLESSATPALPVLAEAFDLLHGSIPEQRGVAIVHGDYKLDNVVLDDRCRVVGVLDWELCTLGDPLADVGALLAYWRAPGEAPRTMVPTPTALDGFPSRAELARRYAEQTGRDLGDVHYFTAFAYWKLVCIAVGVRERLLEGSGGGDRSGADGLAEDVEWYAAAGARAGGGARLTRAYPATVPRIRVAAAQLDLVVGDLEGNVTRILDAY